MNFETEGRNDEDFQDTANSFDSIDRLKMLKPNENTLNTFSRQNFTRMQIPNINIDV